MQKKKDPKKFKFSLNCIEGNTRYNRNTVYYIPRTTLTRCQTHPSFHSPTRFTSSSLSSTLLLPSLTSFACSNARTVSGKSNGWMDTFSSSTLFFGSDRTWLRIIGPLRLGRPPCRGQGVGQLALDGCAICTRRTPPFSDHRRQA